MSFCLVIPADGHTYTETLPNDLHDRFEAMYEVIGRDCHLVELLPLSDQFLMWLDEEGLHRPQPNSPATMLAQRFGWVSQTYHGTAIITGPELPTGLADLSKEQVALLLDLMARA
ncbi:DUF3846 domain-containing protein [Spirillospora sp. CA-108201]